MTEPETSPVYPNDSDLRALPAEYYVSEEVFEREKELLFFRSWQYACHSSEVENPGDYVATDILGQNVFVIRDQDGEIRAFRNVCPHRGHKLVEGKGHTTVLVCPYHQWSFSLDGGLRRLRKTPESHAPAASKVCLTPVSCDQMLGFVFINLDDNAASIAETWPGLETHILETCPDVMSYKLAEGASAVPPADVDCNWKIQVDNYLECQHCRHGHESFADMLDICNQHYTLGENHAYNFIPSAGKADNKAYPLEPEHDVMDLHFWFLFPNIGFGQFSGPGNLSLFQWLPVHTGRGIRVNASLEPAEPTDPGMKERQAMRTKWGEEILQPEDLSFMRSVQEGMHQHTFDQGWYIVDHECQEFSEAMIRHFHQLYQAQMEAPDPSQAQAAE